MLCLLLILQFSYTVLSPSPDYDSRLASLYQYQLTILSTLDRLFSGPGFVVLTIPDIVNVMVTLACHAPAVITRDCEN